MDKLLPQHIGNQINKNASKQIRHIIYLEKYFCIVIKTPASFNLFGLNN